MALKRLYFSKFSWGAWPRTPLEVLAPSTRVGQIRVRPPPPQISMPVRQCLQLKKGSLKWEGSFESLQSLFDLFLNLETKWSTPRGGCRQYVADNGLEIRWYSSSKSLCFNGPDSENLKLQIINFIPKDGVEGEYLAKY